MTNKKIIFIALFAVSAALMLSHPPSDIEISYDLETGIIEVAVRHSVGNPNNHYISEVVITHNDREMLTHRLLKQEDGKGTLFKYRLPDMESGMTLKVTARCNRVGALTKDIVID